MAETSILINDQTGGEVLAMRDAYETDGGSNARIVQRVSLANLHFASPLSAATRTVTTADSKDIDACPAELITNIVEMGDKSNLILFAEFTASGTQDCRVALVFFDENDVAIAMHYPNSLNSSSYVYRTTGETNQLTEALVLNESIKRMSRIGIHIYSTTTTGSVSVWAIPY